MADDAPGFRGGGTPGGRLGCLAAFLFLLACVPLGMAMGFQGGRHVVNYGLWDGLLIVFATASAVGLGARMLINLTVRRDSGKAPLWAVVLVGLLLALTLWRLYAWFGL